MNSSPAAELIRELTYGNPIQAQAKFTRVVFKVIEADYMEGLTHVSATGSPNIREESSVMRLD